MQVPDNSDGKVLTREALPVGFVPMPTNDYRTHRKALQAMVEPGRPTHPATLPIPIPMPLLKGPRVLMWKQDPTVTEIGVRKAYIPSYVLSGPRDARIKIEGLPVVNKNALGDFIETPGTPAFDAVHAFSVVRQTLTMYQRALGGAALPWQWNGAANTDPLSVYPHAGETPNAYYSRTEKALKFFWFTPTGQPTVFTCRSFDIVSHETGHAVLDALKPGWLTFGNPPQTGGLHESFGDLTAIFLCLSQMDQVEAVIAQTKSDLHDKTFLADLAEQFGLALGRPNGLRNADNNLKLSEVGTEVHALSQVFTGGVYDILADIFLFERDIAKKDDARLLYETGQYLCSLVLRSLIQSPDNAATFAHVVNKMLQIAASDGKPVQYRNFIRNRFTVREVVVSPTPLTENVAAGVDMAPGVTDPLGAQQDRRTCCGTMQLDEYLGVEEAMQLQLEDLKRSLRKGTILDIAKIAYKL
jgi:hypothetical protein